MQYSKEILKQVQNDKYHSCHPELVSGSILQYSKEILKQVQNDKNNSYIPRRFRNPQRKQKIMLLLSSACGYFGFVRLKSPHSLNYPTAASYGFNKAKLIACLCFHTRLSLSACGYFAKLTIACAVVRLLNYPTAVINCSIIEAQRLFMLLRDCVPRRLGTVSALGTSSTLLPACFTHLSLFCFHWARRATIQTSKGLHSGFALSSACGYFGFVRLKSPHSLNYPTAAINCSIIEAQRLNDYRTGLRFLFRPRYRSVHI